MVAPALVDPMLDPTAQLIDRVKKLELSVADLKDRAETPRDTGALCMFTPQSIPSGVATPIIFDFALGCTADLGLGIVNGSNTWADPDRIVFLDGTKAQTFFIYLSCTFEANANGYRECGWYHSDTSQRLTRLPPVSGEETGLPFFHYRRLQTPTGWNAAYVKQTSGINLNLTSAVFAVFRYR
jgi:hypothetical protein